MKRKTIISVMMAAAMALTMTACEDETPILSDGGSSPVSSTGSTTVTTTTFAENQGVNDAVAQITDGLEDPDLDVSKRIKWMGHFDIDETSPAAILFKNTYGVPTEGDDPESDGRIFEYTSVAFGERYDKLGAAISSGDSPDLFPFDYQDYPYGVLRGRYQPIDGLLDFDSAKWAATKDLMDQYKLNGRYYVAFWQFSLNNLMYYRKSMIEDIGAEDPRELFEAGNWTWDTFLDIARKWQTSGDGRYVVDGYFPENDFVISTGVPMVGNDGTQLVHNLNDPAVERAENLLFTLYQENLRYPRHELNGWSINPKAWADGQTLFYGEGSLWVWNDVLHKYAQKNGWDDDEVRIVPFPRDPLADKYYVTLNEPSYMWCKGSSYANGVKAWIDCCATAAADKSVNEAAIEQAVENYHWSRDNLEFYYSLTANDGSSPLTFVIDFKGGLGTVSDASSTQSPIQSLTNMPYLTGESFVQLRDMHLPAIQSAIDDINKAISTS